MTLSLQEFGSGKETLFFLPGWPDNHSVWTKSIVPALSKDYRCIVACLPDYDKKKPQRWFGYGVDEVVDMIDRTIESTVPKNQQVTLVLHDWGSYFGLLWCSRKPQRVSKLVVLDVLVVRGDRLKPRELFWIFLYQSFIIAAWVASFVSYTLGNIILFCFFKTGLGPDLDPPPRGHLQPKSWMGYPYFYVWLKTIANKGRTPAAKLPEVPILYVYGTKKRVMFHSQKTIAALKSSPQSKVVELDCGHWIMLKRTDELLKLMKEFLS